MELNRHLGKRLLERLDKALGAHGSEKRRHILDADRVSARVSNALSVLNIVLVGKNGTCGVADGNLSVAALAVSRLDSGLQVLDVVERVKDTDNIDAVRNRALYEILNAVVRVVAVAEHILSAEEHLELCIGAMILDRAKSYPRILVEEAKAGVKRCAAPAFEGIVADFVELVENRKHILGCHSGRNQRLVRVTQRSLRYSDFLCHIALFSPLVQCYEYLA